MPLIVPGIYRSAQKYTGKNVINSLAAIFAAEMMLDFLGEEKAVLAKEKSAIKTIKQMKSMAAGKMGFSTTEIGDMIAAGV